MARRFQEEDSRVQALEREIGQALARGDLRAAATQAIEGYGPELLGLLWGLAPSEDEANDAFAEVCAGLWLGLSTFRGESSVRTWAYRIAWNIAARMKADPFRRRNHRLDTGEAERIAEDVRSRTAPFRRSEAHDVIQAARERLTAEEQLLLILRVDRNLSWREVGAVLASGGQAPSQAALWKRFERVKEKLRALVAQTGLLDE